MNTINITPATATVEMRRHLGMKAYTIVYPTDDNLIKTIDTNGGHTTAAPATEQAQSCRRIVFYPWNWTYDEIVSAIVEAEIPRSRMDAINNNYTERVTLPLLDPETALTLAAATPLPATPEAKTSAEVESPSAPMADTEASAASTPLPASAEAETSAASAEADPSAEAAEAERQRLRREACEEMAWMQTVRAQAKATARHLLTLTSE